MILLKIIVFVSMIMKANLILNHRFFFESAVSFQLIVEKPRFS